MAGPRLFYSIERRGHRDGYKMPDVDGDLLGDEGYQGGYQGGGEGAGQEGGDGVGKGGKEESEGEEEGGGGESGNKGGYWEGLPEELETQVDVEDVLGRWRGYSPVCCVSFSFCPVEGFIGVMMRMLTTTRNTWI